MLVIYNSFVESSVSPGFVAVTRMWYTRREQPIRLGIWYSATGLFSIFSSLVNSRLGNAKTTLAPWKLIFLVPGSITVAFGFLVLLLLPPSPLRLPLLAIPCYNRLTLADRQGIDAKVRGNLTGTPSSAAAMAWNWSQAKEAALDPKIYLFFLMATAIYVTNGAVTVFGPILVKAIGFTSTRATLLLTPGGATTAVSIYVVTLLATSKRLGFAATVPFARTLLLIASCLPPIVGALMCWKGDWSNKAIPLAGYYLIPIFGAPFVLLLGMCTANIAGSTKQAIASASIFVGYNCGNVSLLQLGKRRASPSERLFIFSDQIASSYILVPSEAKDHYPTTFKTVVGVMCATIGLALMLSAVMAWENRRRGGGWFADKDSVSSQPDLRPEEPSEKGEDGRPSQESAAASTLLDVTDRENKDFRYTL